MSYVSFSGQQLVEMHHNGDTNAISELMRRHAKNERASTAKLIEQCGVAVAPATQPTPTETSPMMNQQQILQCIQSGDVQQMQLLQKELETVRARSRQPGGGARYPGAPCRSRSD